MPGFRRHLGDQYNLASAQAKSLCIVVLKNGYQGPIRSATGKMGGKIYRCDGAAGPVVLAEQRLVTVSFPHDTVIGAVIARCKVSRDASNEQICLTHESDGPMACLGE